VGEKKDVSGKQQGKRRWLTEGAAVGKREEVRRGLLRGGEPLSLKRKKEKHCPERKNLKKPRGRKYSNIKKETRALSWEDEKYRFNGGVGIVTKTEQIMYGDEGPLSIVENGESI